MNLKNITGHPETVNEAVNRLLIILPDAEKEQIKALPEDELELLHFSLGKHIRKAFGLYDGNTALLDNLNADDAAMKIIEALWRRKTVCRTL